MIIIDASIANKLILPLEEGHDKTKEIFRKHASEENIIMTLDFIFYEVANTLVTKSSIPQRNITRSLTTIYKTKMNIYYAGEDDIKSAARLAKRFGTSVYDMLYAILAKKYRVKLITADEKFVKATKFKFVKLLQDIE